MPPDGDRLLRLLLGQAGHMLDVLSIQEALGLQPEALALLLHELDRDGFVREEYGRVCLLALGMDYLAEMARHRRGERDE